MVLILNIMRAIAGPEANARAIEIIIPIFKLAAIIVAVILIIGSCSVFFNRISKAQETESEAKLRCFDKYGFSCREESGKHCAWY